ncbi:MAG TPA: acyltransferase family protein, partial [Candidatus Sulfotelmatobacter sp.]|nr:acyltransferase family protein [Candidatus Sulfotelmatobacter sp.]
DFSYEFDLWVVYLAIPLLGAVVLLHVLLPDAGLLSRALSQPWLVYIGKLSYGLYLWHYPIFRQTQAAHQPLTQELALEFGPTAAATLGSFYLIERPMLRIKRTYWT